MKALVALEVPYFGKKQVLKTLLLGAGFLNFGTFHYPRSDKVIQKAKNSS